MFFFFGIRQLKWMKAAPQKQSFSGIMENKTLQSFVKTLAELIGLIVSIPPGQQMRMSFVLTNSGSILRPWLHGVGDPGLVG